MKILLIGSDKDLFNPESAVAQRTISYAQAAGQISVIVFTPYHFVAQSGKGLTSGNFSVVSLSDKVTVYPTNSLNKYFYVFDAVKVGAKIIKEQGIELISTQDPFVAGLAGLLLKRNLKVALNVQIHGDFFSTKYYWRRSWLDKIRRQIAKKVLPAADSIRAVSQRITDSLSKFGLSKEKITVAPIYVDTAKFADQPITIDLRQEFSGKFVILSVGRLVKEKNLGLLIEAVNILVKQGQQVALAIVGQGDEEDNLKSEVRKLDLENNVRFFGWRDDLGSFYKTAGCLAITSKAEGYNRTAVEAMSCGLAVIMTDVGLAGEIVKDNINGFVLKQASASELASKIKALLLNQELKNRLSAGASQTASSLPSQQENMELYLKSWQLALDNHGQK